MVTSFVWADAGWEIGVEASRAEASSSMISTRRREEPSFPYPTLVAPERKLNKSAFNHQPLARQICRENTTGRRKQMKRELFLTVALLVLLVVITYPPPSRGDYNLRLEGDTIKVAWSINASQNITAYTHALLYPPNLNVSLTGNELDSFSSALQTTVQQKVSFASISNVAVRVSSNSPNASCSDACSPQWLNASATFEVREALQTNSGVSRYDLSWKGIRLEQDLEASGVAFNRLGEKYLTGALQQFVNFKNTRSISMTVTVNGQAAPRATYQDLTNAIVLFDTSTIQNPFDTWIHTWNITSQSQTWTNPLNGGFNTTIIERLTEATESVRIAYIAGAKVHAQVTTNSLNTAVRGDIFYTTLPGAFWDQIFLAAIIAPLGILVGTSILERRITKGSKRPTKTGRKNQASKSNK